MQVQALRCDICGIHSYEIAAEGGTVEPIQIGNRRVDMCNKCRSEKPVAEVEAVAEKNGIKVEGPMTATEASARRLNFAEQQQQVKREYVVNLEGFQAQQAEMEQARSIPAPEIPANASDKEIAQIARDHREKWINPSVAEQFPELVPDRSAEIPASLP